MSNVGSPSSEAPATKVPGVALFTLRPPATLFLSGTARRGLKVKYVRHVHPEPSARRTPAEPAAGTATA